MKPVAICVVSLSLALAALANSATTAVQPCSDGSWVSSGRAQHNSLPSPPSHRRAIANTSSPGLATLLLQTEPSTSILAKLLAQTGLLDTLGQDSPVTLFAPTDAAFAALPAGTLEMLARPENLPMLRQILANHVVAGRLSAGQVLSSAELTSAAGQPLPVRTDNDTPTIGNAGIVQTDLRARNITVHVISGVLIPPADNLISTAGKDPTFSTLLTAIRAAGLTETLEGKGPFTVLAPTNEAFAKIGQARIEELLRPENRETLRTVLKYHVIPGRVSSTQALTARQADTAAGRKVTFRLRNGRLTVNDANVTFTDLSTANGTIHVIDSVLIP
jgi:uncharacterized surface protein with fasciclin (FAS1) repeats